MGYSDYLEQLTYLIFLKMADKCARPPHSRDGGVPAEYRWETLKSRKGAELEAHHIKLLRELGRQHGMLGQIFTKPQNKIQGPTKLYRLIQAIVECVQPQSDRTVADPAAGTGGFLLAAYDYIVKYHDQDKRQARQLKSETFHGN